MVPVSHLRLSWLLFSEGFYVSPAKLLMKRFSSLVVSITCLILTLPVMGLIALAIRLNSPGPVFFRQKRIGKDGKAFLLYKFRSMYVDADPVKPALEGDARITKVGNFLRRVRLDELPQLFNILRGDMYFVGPRPFVEAAEEECVRKIPFYGQRWTISPGLTGWAQIHNGYCATLEDNIEKLGYDLFYIKNMSLGLDLLILFQTTKILLLGRGAR
jgi:lipopolysaccharide/colanic/teichoic acid biosynthesis glycosyltransferase